jgi:hypothetical protein
MARAVLKTQITHAVMARPEGCVAYEFSTNPHYANPTRDGLTMGHMTDFELANRYVPCRPQ